MIAAFFNCFRSHRTKTNTASTVVDEENFQDHGKADQKSAVSPLTGSFCFITRTRVTNHESPVASVLDSDLQAPQKSDSDSENRSNNRAREAFDRKSDSEDELWTSSRSKRSCSDLTASPVSVSSAEKAQILLPSKSRRLWRKLRNWSRQNLREIQTGTPTNDKTESVDGWIEESCAAAAAAAALPRDESDAPSQLERGGGRRKGSSHRNSPAEDVQPPPFDSSSSVAHLSGIGLKSIPPQISLFSTLRAVNLSRNSIVTISPGSLPKGLRALDLSKNKIHTVEGLKDLVRLRVLNLSRNRISRIGQGLSGCTAIKELNLSGNKISVVDGMHRLLKLTVLDLSFNKITEAKALGQLVANYDSLLALNLSGNPLQSSLSYIQIQRTVAGLLPKLALLNKQPINSQKAREIRGDANAKAALGNGTWISKKKKSGERLLLLLQSRKEKSSSVNAKQRNKRRSKPKQRSKN